MLEPIAISQKLKIGKIKYLNCLPYYAGWTAGDGTQFIEGSPAEMNRGMRAAEIDVAPISSLEYLMHPGDYWLLPLGIASRGLVRSVTLFSKKKIEALNGAKIAVTQESLTSVYLLDLILRDKYGVQADLIAVPSDPKAMLAAHDAALLIGNDALLAQPRKWLERYDLGELWQNWQNLPFVFAVWAARRGSELTEEKARDFERVLRERLRYNFTRLAECIQQACHIGEYDKLYPKVFGYLNNLQYELDETCMRGLKKFAELAAAHRWCAELNQNFAALNQ